MPTPRFLKGVRKIEGVDIYGIWLSKPGKNVLTATDPEDFLVSPLRKNAQVLDRGAMLLKAGESVVKPFPDELPNIPYVKFQTSDQSGVSLVPFFYHGYFNPKVTATITKSDVTFFNGSASPISLTYLVMFEQVA